MNRPINKALEGALDRYFASFDGTRELAAELIAKRKHPIEALILLCARLDALASDAAKDDMSSRKAFTAFVAAYGGHRDLFNSVSVGDLYYELTYHRWLLEGMIPSPGRLQHVFSRLDEPILHLLDEAGLPLTLKDSEALLDTLIRICKQEYRAVPGHRVTKPRVAKIAALQNVFALRDKTHEAQEICGQFAPGPHSAFGADEDQQHSMSVSDQNRSMARRSFWIRDASSQRGIYILEDSVFALLWTI